jgi:uncharacterized protein
MIEFDPEKDAANIRRHRISLSQASRLFAGVRFIERDDPTPGEQRFIAIGLIEARVFACVYTWRGDNRRIISLRKATRRETHDFYEAPHRRS